MQYIFRSLILASTAICFTAPAIAAPAIVWTPDSIEPGNVVMLYGGGLANVEARAWRFSDTASGTHADEREAPTGGNPVQPILQASDQSVKFILPASFQPGVFSVQLKAPDGTSASAIINRPEIWFMQPTRLMPGLDANQSPAGAAVQIIGKDFLLPGDKGTPRITIGRAGEAGKIIEITRAERFSLLAKLPADLSPGKYVLSVHNGFGGVAGWSIPLAIEIKPADKWPEKIFDVKKDFAAKGDDVTDDTAAIESALAAAEKNGGGVVYFPWGTYRLTRAIILPPHTLIKGENRDASILKWPVDEPQTLADFSPVAIYGQAPYAIEDLSIIGRKVDCLLKDLHSGKQIPKELQDRAKAAADHDVFIRRVNFQHWLMVSHPNRNAALWSTKYTGEGSDILMVIGIKNFELSDCQAQGGNLHIRNIRNARETGNLFGNEMGYCWTEMGGGAHYVISEGNDIHASSSWGYGNIGMKYVYSAHNKSYNFVRGEREAMTLDISALTTPDPQKNIAWFGQPTKVEGNTLTLTGIKAADNEFVDLCVMILDGPGRGQFRTITANTPTLFTLDRPWDVPPDTTSTIGLWLLMRHMIVYKSEGYDCSAFAQLYGSYYDYIVDSCKVERNQGIWGQSGWFVQFRYNDVRYANTYHPGIGPHGNNMEKNCPFSFVGLTDGILRVTKFGSTQYGKKLVFVNEVVPHPVPGVLGAIVRGNTLQYNQRIAFPPNADPTTKNPGPPRMIDVVIDSNEIDHSPIGIQVGPQTHSVLINNNHFTDVERPYAISSPEQVKLVEGAKP